jgi:hypothetical protein
MLRRTPNLINKPHLQTYIIAPHKGSLKAPHYSSYLMLTGVISEQMSSTFDAMDAHLGARPLKIAGEG